MDDCLEALKHKDNDPQVWRILGRSRYFVEKWEDGLKFVNQGLEKCPGDAKLKELQSNFQIRIDNEKIIVEQVDALKKAKGNKKLDFYRKLREKKLKIGNKVELFQDIPDHVNTNITIDKEGKAHFPVFLLYDQFMQTDFIEDWREDQTLRQQLTPIFVSQAPWDADHDYQMDSIEVYFQAD